MWISLYLLVDNTLLSNDLLFSMLCFLGDQFCKDYICKAVFALPPYFFNITHCLFVCLFKQQILEYFSSICRIIFHSLNDYDTSSYYYYYHYYSYLFISSSNIKDLLYKIFLHYNISHYILC